MLKHPLSLLDRPADYIAWQEEVGPEEAQRQIEQATREHMAEHGPRSALDVVEKLTNMSAQLEEFVA